MSNATRFALSLLASLALSLPAQADPRLNARDHYNAGLEAAAHRDFEIAVEEFQLAQAFYPHPHTLYNLARAQRDAGNNADALETFLHYQESAPGDAERVAKTITNLQSVLKANNAHEPNSTQPAAATEAPRLTDIHTNDVAFQETVISETRQSQGALDVTMSMSVLSRNDIRLSGARTIPDLLRQLPGLEVMSLSPAQPDVSIRGMNREMSNKVLVLVDGRTITWDAWGTPIWAAIPIAIDEIERIEVIRGPGSAVYGASAIGGVVNIITDPDESKNGHIRLTQGLAGAGEKSASMTTNAGEWMLRLKAGSQLTAASSEDPTTPPKGLNLPSLFPSSIASKTKWAGIHMSREIGPNHLSLSAGNTEGQTQFYAWGGLGLYEMPFSANFAQAKFHGKKFEVNTYLNTTWADGPHPTSSTGDLDTELISQVANLESFAHHSFSVWGVKHRLLGGFELRGKRVQWGYLEHGGLQEVHKGGFVQDEAHWGKLTIVSALRADLHPLMSLSESLAPRLAFNYRIRPNTALRGSYGKAYRLPNLMESHLFFHQATGVENTVIQVTGNEDLQPEALQGFEIGLRQESNRYVADIAIWENHLSGLIKSTDISFLPTPLPLDEESTWVGSASFKSDDSFWRFRGAEFFQRIAPTDRLDITNSISLTQVTGFTQSGETRSAYSTSPIKASVGIAWQVGQRGVLAGQYHYTSGQAWALPGFDETGKAVSSQALLPARGLLTTHFGLRLGNIKSPVELALDTWNLPGLISGKRFQEHPKGQWLDGRIFASGRMQF